MQMFAEGFSVMSDSCIGLKTYYIYNTKFLFILERVADMFFLCLLGGKHHTFDLLHQLKQIKLFFLTNSSEFILSCLHPPVYV